MNVGGLRKEGDPVPEEALPKPKVVKKEAPPAKEKPATPPKEMKEEAKKPATKYQPPESKESARSKKSQESSTVVNERDAKEYTKDLIEKTSQEAIHVEEKHEA